MKLTEKSVEDEVLNYCPYYYDLVDVMGDRISTNPTGSYSTTADFDAAGAALREATVGSNSEDDGEDEEGGESLESGSGSEEEGEGDKDGMEDKKKEAGGKVKGKEKEAKTAKEKESQEHEKGEKQSGPLSKKMKVKKEGAGRPSDTGRKFGKQDASSTTPKRKISAVESAIEVRSVERTKMDATRNAAKVKAEKLDALMKIAHKLQDADHTLSFTEAMQEAKEIYNDI
ncbi:hypothetical protein CF319_g8460 [Tilletia indica]|nr:hypothetical protein CF319_g8460 [Tilletia indica]